METNDPNKNNPGGSIRYNAPGRVLGGMVIVIAGSLLLARSAGALLPAWLFTWPVFLIGLGIFFLARNAFRKPGGLLLILIGGFFLAGNLYPGLSIGRFFWPALLIIAGLAYMFSRGGRHRYCDPNEGGSWRFRQRYRQGAFGTSVTVGSGTEQAADPDSVVEILTMFGGTKKKVISKNFKGGEIVTAFGGTELDLSQAEIQGPVVLELTQIFGGTKLIIPAHWHLRPELVTVLGGTDDKRNLSNLPADASKTLILQGTVILGGIDIRSYQ